MTATEGTECACGCGYRFESKDLAAVQSVLIAESNRVKRARAERDALSATITEAREKLGTFILQSLQDEGTPDPEVVAADDILARGVPDPWCMCDGGSYFTTTENAFRKPFIVVPTCPIHGGAAVYAANNY